MNTREKVLKEALNCVNGEREKQYGNPEDNFKRIATLWTDYINMSFKGFFEAHKLGGIILEPIDVAKMMILFKIARSNGDEDKLDNYIDMIGYGACAAEIFESSEKAEQVLKKKEELGLQLADECKDCDYAKKCMGTGVCLKEKESEDLYRYFMKKNFGKEAQQWAESMKVFGGNGDGKEASEAINECMCENKINYGSYLQSYNNISACIVRESSRANVNPCDVVNNLTCNKHAPTEMAFLLANGKLNFNNVAVYIDDAINEVKKKDKKWADYR